MPGKLDEDLEKLLRTLAQIYAMQGKRREVMILAKSKAEIEEAEYDGWDGGTYGYTIYLWVKPSLYAQIEEDINRIEKDIKERADPLLRCYHNQYIKSVVISLEMEDDKNWRKNAEKWLGTIQKPVAVKKDIHGNLTYDVFISHATEDKAGIVRPLAHGLSAAGLRVWYDEFELKLGDSLSQSIDYGLASSRYGIVVLSRAFFGKNWPRYELDGLVARQMVGKKVILPIWHGITREEVVKYSPPLVDKLALNTSNISIDEMIKEILNVLGESGEQD